MPFHRLYEAVTNARISLYEQGVFKSFALGAKCISVGNITVGGTGKTPLVAFIADVLAENGEKVCILTRGYKRENPKKRILVSDGKTILADARQAGDEPFELAVKLSGKAVIVADANRVEAGKWAREKFAVTAFVLDDAFQHLKVERDLDIVCVDATNPFGNEKTLPSGILRESLKNLKRADAVIVTRANLVENVSDLKSQIAGYNSHCPIFITENIIANLIELENFSAETQDSPTAIDRRLLSGHRFLAFCALGNPENFFEQLRREKFNLTNTEKFPDHHFYTLDDIEKLSAKAEQSGADALLTTAKDAVKLKDLKFALPCYVVESKMIFEEDLEFRKLILEVKAER